MGDLKEQIRLRDLINSLNQPKNTSSSMGKPAGRKSNAVPCPCSNKHKEGENGSNS